MNVSRRFVDWAGLIAVVAIAMVVRFHSITVPAVWYDEAYSLLLADGSPSYIWSTTARDVHPPLYYVLLHYWMLLFGNGVLSARSLSTLADVGTLLLCIKLMSVVATRRATWIAAVLLALLPISVRYSQEIRMYTLLGFWLMGATVALVCWVNSPQRKRFAILYVLLMTAAFYTHYFAALCVLVHWLFWWQARGLSVRAWTAANIVIVFLYLPWVPYFLHQLSGMGGQAWIEPLTGHTVLTIVWLFTVMNDSVPVSSSLRAVPTFLILICSVWALSNDRSEPRYSVLLIGYFFVPAIALLLIALFTPAFVPRYLLFAAVGLPLIVAVAVDSWSHQQRTFAIATLAIFVVVEVQGLIGVYENREGKTGRLDEIVARISLELKPDDEILIDSLLWYLPFMYYNTTGVQPRVHARSSSDPTWGYPDKGGWALISPSLKWIFLEDVAVSRVPTRRVWWVTRSGLPESTTKFPARWQQMLTINGGDVEARLFTLDGTVTSSEAGEGVFLTQQPPH